jgi:DNA polymerase II large subunit
MNIQNYFKNLRKQVDKIYSVARDARSKGLDPVSDVEIPLAMTMAEKVVGLVSVLYPQIKGVGIAKRILEFEKEYGKLDPTVSFKIAEEVAKQKFCKFDSLLQAIEAGIRIGFAYTTLGVVSSPIEGFTELKLGKTKEGKDYFIANFSGPIRSAGTTANCVALFLIDYLREVFGFAKFDATEEEIKRYVTENTDYHERVTNLQYFPTEEEMHFLGKNLPFQISGEPTSKIEVSNYKNLKRIETNYIRGGMCLVFSEGLAQKAQKGLRLLNITKKNGIKSTGFDFLEEYLKLHEKREKGKADSSPTYINDLVAGRPVFGHPSRSGGFRFRYGRGRSSGFSGVSIHPATMAITDNFIAIGTQLKTEKPIKGTVTTSCDTIDGPIVKLKNGCVKKINDVDEAKKIYKNVEEIIYLGDILFSFGDVLNRNSPLLKSGYVEEWWNLDLKKKNKNEKLNYLDVSIEDAINLSKKYGIPLHPNYIFYWNEISNEQFLGLINWLGNSIINPLSLEKGGLKIVLPFNNSEKEKFSLGKRALELLGVCHDVVIENIVIDEINSKALLVNLGVDFNMDKDSIKTQLKELVNKVKENNVLNEINKLSEFKIKDKSGDFIGTRMGRPEKAKLRKLVGSPNVLFPVGKQGGRLRSVQTALETGKVRSSFPLFYCGKCNKETIYPCCEVCNTKCKKKYYFYSTKEKSFEDEIEGCEKKGVPYYSFDLDVNYYFNKAREKIGFLKSDVPLLIKGVRGTSSGGHMTEHLSKGILRATHGLQVNKDGTIRYDATELPLVSFKAKEISVSIEKLKELGYTHDIHGNELVNDNQILELMPHDLLLPSFKDSLEEKADDVFVNVCKFIDDLLVKFYKIKPYYNVKTRDDLVGKLGVCMAPHNCAGVICRFIGFSNTLGILASPYMHAAIRRDCDGDEAAIMLLGDVLINFSREFLPSHRGGTQDAPLVLNAKIDAGEVDDQILDFDIVNEYPLKLYEYAEQRKHSSEVKIKMVKDVLKEGGNPLIHLGFTHDVSDFNLGVGCSNYKLLETMQDKVNHQMELVEKIRAVDTSDTARLIIERHFIRDMRGNLRKFSMQRFRCVACNEIVRRPPLSGACPKCRGKLIFTIHEGGIRKYLDTAIELSKKYNLSLYLKQNLELLKKYIDSIFGRELEKQEALEKWF